MTAHPQAQPMPGTVPAAAPVQPIAQGAAPKAKGASRNAKIVLGLSLLAATAGVSFAVGHVTAEEAGGTTTSPFAAGAFPSGAMGSADATGETAAVDAATGGSASTGSEPGGVSALSLVALDETDSEAALAVEAAPAAPPDGATGQRGATGGMPGGSAGTVAEITDSSLTITAADGSQTTFSLDGSTSWVQQEAIDASVVQQGHEVTAEVPFTGPGGEATDESAPAVATQVTVTAPTT